MKNLGVYIHIPFCKRKCIYCDFTSYTDLGMQERYFAALFKEIEYNKEILSSYNIDSIFFGGGTPSIVESKYICEIIERLSKFNLSKKAEITIEVNPGTANDDKIFDYKNSGVNRLSIGLQSANDDELKSLMRIHNKDDFIKTYELAKKHGINNINADIMFGIMGQNEESFNNTLKFATSLDLQHISCYSLIVEENTPLFKMNLNSLPDEETEQKMYRSCVEHLKSNGFLLYEISNFSKPGFSCYHNLKYWEMKDYLGIGVSAHSFIDNKRHYNYSDINLYMDNNPPIEEKYDISNEELFKEEILTGMRLLKGINIDEINKKYKIDFLENYNNIIDKYIKLNCLIIDNNSLKFSDKGLWISNYILSDFM